MKVCIDVYDKSSLKSCNILLGPKKTYRYRFKYIQFFLYIFIHVFNAHQYSCFKYFGVIFPTFFENKSFVIHVIVDSCSLLMFEITFLWRGSAEQRVIVAEANLAEY